MGSLWRRLFPRQEGATTADTLRRRLDDLRHLVDENNRVLELIARAGEMLGGEYIFDRNTLVALASDLEDATREVVFDLNAITGGRYPQLADAVRRVSSAVEAELEQRVFVPEAELVIPLTEVGEELADAVGEKMARLGALQRLDDCSTPLGFVVSAHACQRLLAEAGAIALAERVDAAWAAASATERAAFASDLRRRVLEAPLPRDLARALRRGLAALRRRGADGGLAVRSSALGEDGEMSFAGQYETVLGVAPDGVENAVRQVVASLYAPGVMSYRAEAGLHPARAAMAVGVLAMVPARASGVAYTLDPVSPDTERMVVAAACGLGRAVVEGATPVDRFEVAREAPHAVLSRRLAHKQAMDVVTRRGGVERRGVPEEERGQPAVSDEELGRVAAVALSIERYMKSAQDVEWAIDDDGRLFILQTRPLRLGVRSPAAHRDLAEATSRHRVLLEGRGLVACRGIAAGPVRLVMGGGDLDALPRNAVIVARTSSPRLAAAVARAAAVITDIGTTTGHLAAITREFRIPAIVDAGNATELLAGVGEVTVDTEENVVYEGRVDELIDYQLLREASFVDAPEFRLLRRMLKRIAPLYLRDPRGSEFFPQYCRTYHDIIRFAHEKAMEELAEGSRLSPRPGNPHVRRLELPVPLDLIVVDLGGGLTGSAVDRVVRLDQVRSRPLQVLAEGLTTEGVWATGPADMDLQGFMSSLTRSQALTDQLALRPELNVAVVTRDYLNLNLRLGYHFNIIDCVLGPDRSHNSIYFRFAGGVTELTRRSRRSRVLRGILEAYDFVVEGEGDLVVARVKKLPNAAMTERLLMLGRLIGFTRQLDILLRDDDIVDECVESFLDGRYAAILERGRGTEEPRHP